VDKMRFFLKTSKRMYGPKCYKEQCFDQPSDSRYFLVIELF
jgi:hypothetical protein